MADLYELLVTADLPDDLSEAEVAELRWHLGLGPEPEEFSIVTDFPEEFIDDLDDPRVVESGEGYWAAVRYPALAQRGAAARIRGVLFSALERRGPEERRSGWALTSRQEIHADEFHVPTQFIRWLDRRVRDSAFDLSLHMRFYEDDVLAPASLLDGELVTREIVSVSPSPRSCA
ncbi:hypothetical protein [Nonomuraea endophytica]|uniref:Uncharacterized protein n=1 Tax=Nonomuraea endophytica TaxID=714136 RepID=A0A7W7ZXP2_9ACTN|nr:hypothetical protein [Nonomuraea endophytica]MBB5075364.1 hypothetical protein [Nonomuraea endophytica]